MNIKIYCSEYMYRRYFLISAKTLKDAKMYIEDQESDEYGCEYIEPFIMEKNITEVQGLLIEEVEHEVEEYNEVK